MLKDKIYSLIEYTPDGDNRDTDLYDYFMLAIISLSIIPLCFKHEHRILNYIEICCVVIFIFDYILRWIVAKKLLQRTSNIAYLVYPITPFAIVDLLSIIPIFDIISPTFRVIRMLRFLRVMRVFKLLKYSHSYNVLVAVIKQEKNALFVVSIFSGAYILVSALILFNVEPDSFSTFFDALYWSVVTLTTVGYGDIYPTTVIGKIFGMLSSLLGIAIVALPTGIIAAGYIKVIDKE